MSAARMAVSDTLVLAKRNFLRIARAPSIVASRTTLSI